MMLMMVMMLVRMIVMKMSFRIQLRVFLVPDDIMEGLIGASAWAHMA